MNRIKSIGTMLLVLLIGIASGYFLSKKTRLTEQTSEDKTNTQIGGEAEIWTCSMHPQIRQDHPGDCPLCGMDLIPLEQNTSSDPLLLEMTSEAVKLANIQTTVVGNSKGHSEKFIRLSGKVKEDERLTSSQVAHVPGRIEKLYVSFTGETVRKGQKLATIYSPELITAQRELIEALKLGTISPGLVEAARNKLRYWKISQATIDRIERDGSIRETFDIYADNSGIVDRRHVAVGDYVKLGQPIFDIINLSKVWVLFDAYEEDLAEISLGDRIEFTTPSMPGRVFKSRVSFIDPVINPETRVASVRTELSNSAGRLKPEMFVNGQIRKTLNKSSNLTVPKSAVLWTGKRSVVYVKKPDTEIPSYEFREIEIGESLGTDYRVLTGLEPGEEVVTYGAFTIDAAAQLNNQASMMNKQVMLKGADHTEHLPDYTSVSPVAFKNQLSELAGAYMALKDALVNTDSLASVKAAEGILDKLNQVDMTLLKGDAHSYWMKQLKAMEAHGAKISETELIEEQRAQFDFLSQSFVKTIKVFGVPKDTYYVQHCPMAFENQGADWVSNEKEIKNPYFGEKMLKCGIVKDSIDKHYKNPPMESTAGQTNSVHRH